MPRDDDDEPRRKKRPSDNNDEPRPKKRRPVDDDEDDEPRARRKVRDDDHDEVDDYDDAPPARRKKSGKKGEGLSKVVPYRNKAALFSYYCGVFSFIPVLCFLLGPIAFILGIFGFLKARNSTQAHGTGHAIAGLLMGLASPPLWIILWYTVFEKMTQPKG